MKTGRIPPPVLIVALCLLSWWLLAPGHASAEWSFDAYVGGAFAPDGDSETQGTRRELHVEDAYMIGGRLGYWLGFFPYLGVAFDASYVTSDLSADEGFEDADLRRIPLSGLVLFRLPLWATAAVPRGHLQPYVAAGPTLLLSELDTRDFDQTREDVGLDARAGLNLRLTRGLGLFAEYRLTYVDQTFEFSRQGLRSVVETDPSTHHILGGISLRF